MLKWSDLRLVKVVFWREISGIHFMHIAIVCILALLVFIPGIIRIKKKKSTIVDVILSYLLCVCVGIVLLITIFRREAGYPRNIISPFPTWENYGGNWFKTIFSFFNIILFVPFGLLVRLKQYRVPEKKAFLAKHHIALWDVIASCDIKGSSDASITNVVANDLSVILDVADIHGIFVNGRTAEKYYKLYSEDITCRKAVCLPSTSPANAAWNTEKLVKAWSEAVR